MTVNCDVAVLGGGVNGLMTGLELVKLGVDVVVLSERSVAAYSSTRNQGWLQSGALWASHYGRCAFVQEMRGGFDAFRTYYPDALRPCEPTLMILRDGNRQRHILEICQLWGLPCERQTMLWATQRIPILADASSTGSAVTVDDMCIDSYAMLSQVVREYQSHGGRFVNGQPDAVSQVSADDGQWLISTPDVAIRARTFILAAGAASRNLLTVSGIDDIISDHVRIPVLSINDPVVDRIIAWPDGMPLVSVVPFQSDLSAIRGATVLLFDQRFKMQDDRLSTNDPKLLLWLHFVEQAFLRNMPGLLGSSRELDGLIYSCFKPIGENDGIVVRSFRRGTSRGVLISSEFLTLAPLAAKRGTSLVLGLLNQSRSGTRQARQLGTPLATVMTQPYRYTNPEFLPPNTLACKIVTGDGRVRITMTDASID